MNALKEKEGEIKAGCCRTSNSGYLQCKHIIHVVGPNYKEIKSEYDSKQLLEKTINNIIFEAEVNLKVNSIAIPAISCGGTYKFPKNICAKIFFNTIL
jgi:O-acetyl-ADP-ribose deacetylase (regulator of RNase III)